ncbi:MULTISPECIES: hypothetical protein [unclassified Lactococcus]|nr:MULTISPECIES: hypothetical protein [unclassified Lactococcus]
MAQTQQIANQKAEKYRAIKEDELKVLKAEKKGNQCRKSIERSTC